MSASQRVDVFCRVIDNYGDIGICWRLTKSLSTVLQHRNFTVRLWVDDLTAFSHLEPAIDPQQPEQTLRGIQICDWKCAQAGVLKPADWVIEAFGCDLPAAYQAQMPGVTQCWVNLEYLSAEPWVEGCHGLPSPQTNGLTKYFFFPGFSTATGGLLRASGDVVDIDDNWDIKAWPDPLKKSLRATRSAGHCLMFLFCYPDHAPLSALKAALQAHWEATGKRSYLFVPTRGASGDWVEPPEGQGWVMCPVPFVVQEEFDRILRSSDLNFVRGEDSAVRAIWAGKPWIWQLYPQAENAHWEKLNAWLNHAQLPTPICTAFEAWNGVKAGAAESAGSAAGAGSEAAPGSERAADSEHAAELAGSAAKACAAAEPDPETVRVLLQVLEEPVWEQWQTAALVYRAQQAAMPDVVSQLVAFCQNPAHHNKK